jgi:hypothetical protein
MRSQISLFSQSAGELQAACGRGLLEDVEIDPQRFWTIAG